MKGSISLFALMAFAITLNVNAGSMHKVFGTHDKVIKNSSKINLWIIDPVPVLSLEQFQGENYIYDFRILQTKVLSKKIGLSLTSAILDSTQYVYDVNKKCPFMGKYAVQFKQGKTTVSIILSEVCPKAIIFCPGSVIDKKHIDLIESSSIFSAIAGLFGNESTIEKSKK